MWIRPSPEREPWLAFADETTQVPRVLDASRLADRGVTTKHDERREPLLPCLLGVRETEVERMLAREKRRHQVAWQFASEVRAEMPEVVFLRCPDGAIGEKRRNAMPAESPDLVVAVDPRVHALQRTQLGSRRAKLHGDDGGLAAKGVGQHLLAGRRQDGPGDREAGPVGSVTRITKSNIV